jgi:thioredoxin reductase (NADPH)
VAMETAIALSQQPGTEVTVSYRGADFVRGKARNIAELKRRVAAGTIQLLWQSEVSRLEPGRAVVGNRTIPCDSVFVLIGSIPAGDLLGQIVQIAARPGPFNLVEPANRPETHP